jgi:hypothetical protein
VVSSVAIPEDRQRAAGASAIFGQRVLLTEKRAMFPRTPHFIASGGHEDRTVATRTSSREQRTTLLLSEAQGAFHR